MFAFFDPLEILKKYFYFEFSHSHGDNALSFKLNKKIDKARNNVAKFYNWNSSKISFLPNKHVFKRLIFKNIDVLNKTVYTDEIDNKYLKNAKKVIYINELSKSIEIEDNSIIWLSNLKQFPEIKWFKDMKIKNSWIYISCDFLLYKNNKKCFKYIDCFTFDPSKTLNLDGILIFGYKKSQIKELVYWGSKSIKSIKGIDVVVSDFPQSLECGTQNYPLLLLIEKYFFYLSNKYSLIKKQMKKKHSSENFNNNFLWN